MLIAIAHGGGITQANLRRVLDVTAPVVSRMLDALEEERDLVSRTVYELDRRTLWVTLTERGAALLENARRELLEEGFTEVALRSVVSAEPTNEPITARAFLETNRFLRTLRRRVVDASTLWYPAYLRSDERSPDFPVRHGWSAASRRPDPHR
jgi:DNA-binding MarR family transcriptional regulator